jgi:RNA polymerase sigma-70 factor (ECF subfamily)
MVAALDTDLRGTLFTPVVVTMGNVSKESRMSDFEGLYKRYGPMVFRRCRMMLKDEDAAWDAVQEVFVLVLRHQDRFRQTGHSSLLYTMATNHCLNVIKARRRKGRGLERELGELTAIDRSTDAVVAQDAVDRILSLFDQTTRTIAWMHFVDGMTLEETARAARMSVSGIRKRLRKLQAAGRSSEEGPHEV